MHCPLKMNQKSGDVLGCRSLAILTNNTTQAIEKLESILGNSK
jgi:hypothetical protein